VRADEAENQAEGEKAVEEANVKLAEEGSSRSGRSAYMPSVGLLPRSKFARQAEEPRVSRAFQQAL
jgi:hypothetical protein